MAVKHVLVWFMGGLLMLAGSWIMSNLEMTVGVTQMSYYMAMVAALVLFLLAGMCWIFAANSGRR